MSGLVGSLMVSIVLLMAAILAAKTGTAHAYIDISTGSLIFQGFLAALFGGLFALKVFWGRITNRVSTLLSKIRTREAPRP